MKLGTQFIHLEAHALIARGKRRGVHGVLYEASRRAGYCEHVDSPREPIMVFGMTIGELLVEHAGRVEEARLRTRNGVVRRARPDQLTLLSCVCSCAVRWDDVKHNREAQITLKKWCDRLINFLRCKYGEQLKTVVMHVDEQYIHVHAYLLPENTSASASTLHPGLSAKALREREILSGGGTKREANYAGNRQYLRAMRSFQDEYSEEVGIPSGQARIGPSRLRLTRDEWQARRTEYSLLQRKQAELEDQATQLDRTAAKLTRNVDYLPNDYYIIEPDSRYTFNQIHE